MVVGGQLCMLAVLCLGKELPEPAEQEAGWVRDNP